MTNKYTGEVKMEIGGKLAKLFYGWRELAEIQSRFGQEVLGTLNMNADIDKLLEILLIGLQKHSPDISKAFVEESSPPILEILERVDLALCLAYYGPEGTAALKGEPKGDDGDEKNVLQVNG